MPMTLADFLSLFNEWDKFVVVCSTTDGNTVSIEINYDSFKYGLYDANFMSFAVKSIIKNSKGVTIYLV